MYHRSFDTVILELSKGLRLAFTTDGWKSISTESFIATACHFISLVILFHISVPFRKRKRIEGSCYITDNEVNIVKTCEIAKLPDIGCFDHLLNPCNESIFIFK
jgi:hypothetical protein